MKKLFFCAVVLLLITACKNKKKNAEDNSQYFPILSFLKSQVAQVDTTLFAIKKLVKRDSTWDTIYVRREDFRKEVTPFLEIPDLTDKKYKDDFTETKIFDESLNKAILTYTPIDADEATRREEVVIQPDMQNGDKVYSIYATQSFVKKDSIIQKNLFWQVDNYCEMITIAQKKDGKEKVEHIRIIWANPLRQ
jgi:hypothetical protein